MHENQSPPCLNRTNSLVLMDLVWFGLVLLFQFVASTVQSTNIKKDKRKEKEKPDLQSRKEVVVGYVGLKQ